MLKQLNSDKDISDDEMRGAQGRVQELTDNFVKKVDEIAKVKEEEVMAV
jgi:ribosome recycling factor